MKVSVEQYLGRISGSKHLHIFEDFCFVLLCFLAAPCGFGSKSPNHWTAKEFPKVLIWLLPNCSPPVSWKHENKLISHENLAVSTVPDT